MGQEISQRWCKGCNEQVKAVRTTPNHLLHLVLSVVTGGLWIIVWIALSAFGADWLCDRCGGKTKAGKGSWLLPF